MIAVSLLKGKLILTDKFVPSDVAVNVFMRYIKIRKYKKKIYRKNLTAIATFVKRKNYHHTGKGLKKSESKFKKERNKTKINISIAT